MDEAGQTGRVDTGAGVRVSFRTHASDGLVKPHVHFARWCRRHGCSANAEVELTGTNISVLCAWCPSSACHAPEIVSLRTYELVRLHV